MRTDKAILLVDDDRFGAEIIEHYLSNIDEFNFNITYAESYQRGIEIIQKHKFDLYLFDYNLGAYTSIQLIENMKPMLIDYKTDTLLPIVLFTGMHQQEIVSKAFKVGAVDFMCKDHTNQISLHQLISNTLYKFESKLLLREHNLKMIARNYELQRFYQTVSHELKTPLTAIKESICLINDGVVGETNEKQDHLLKIAINNADLMHQFVNDLVDLSRIETGKFKLYPDYHSISEIIERSIDAVRFKAANKNIEIEFDCSGETNVFVDSKRIIQVIINLLTNAIKFSSNNTTIKISLSLSSSDDVTVYVEDNGPGISLKDQNNIFNRLYQVNSERDYLQESGMGIGLNLCKEFIKYHGDRDIQVKSTLGKGSTFYFNVPINNEWYTTEH